MGIVPRSEVASGSKRRSDGASVTFSILGVGVRVKGCPASDIEPVLREYSAFQTDSVVSAWEIEWNGRETPTTLTFDGKVHPGISPKTAAPIVSTKMMDYVYRMSEDHYLFHGAAAAWRGGLLTFPGESGAGKSSLAISLGRRGWSLFSDEVIALSREDFRAVPFPRAMLVRRESPALGEILQDVKRREEFLPARRGRSKAMIPFDFFNEAPLPLSPKAIVCLRGGRREVRRGGTEIAVTLWDDRMEKLAREKGIYDGLEARRVGEFWCIRSDSMEIVEDICSSLGGIVIERDVVEDRPSAFGKTAKLEPISPSEGLSSLWSVFENGRALAHHEESIPALYMRVAKFVTTMPCFWLRPGLPSDTCELLQHLAEELARRDVSRE